MNETLHKYQSEYENSNGCFWDTKPASYVRLFLEKYGKDIYGKQVLDLGAGEGKNAVYLANLGAEVTAVDVSPVALGRFSQQPNFANCSDRIKYINQDMTDADFSRSSFDIIVAYGVLHCLDSAEQVFQMVNRISNWLNPAGFFICATFTNKLPVPTVQSYLDEKSFLEEGELENLLTEFTLLESENSIITETHPTSNIEHQHSIVRLIAQKI